MTETREAMTRPTRSLTGWVPRLPPVRPRVRGGARAGPSRCLGRASRDHEREQRHARRRCLRLLHRPDPWHGYPGAAREQP